MHFLEWKSIYLPYICIYIYVYAHRCSFLLQNGTLWDKGLVHCGICATGLGDINFKKHKLCNMLGIKSMSTSCEIALWSMPQNIFDDKLTLVQIPSHYPRQGWPWVVSPHGITRPQWVNTLRQRQMNTISQATFSNAFSWMKMYEFRLRFHWSLFLRVQLTIFKHWFR